MFQVKFVGEGGIDYGGPRREFFRLLALTAKETLFIGTGDQKFFNTNVSAIQVRCYNYCVIQAIINLCSPISYYAGTEFL